MLGKLKWLAVMPFFLYTIAIASPPDSLIRDNWRKPRFFFQLDRYNSFVSTIGANCSGFKTGLEYARKYRFGIGFYNLKSDIIEYKSLNAKDAANADSDFVKSR